jgi:L-2-hydroxyglutarate oxidase LhgO
MARNGRSTIVLERTSGIGTGISSRNSEVIHAGIYYPTDTLKHRLCVKGRRLLYPYLEARGVAHRRCGKLIVATNDQENEQIDSIYRQGLANEVEGLSLMTGPAAMALEPDLYCTAAVWSANTGIFDSHGFMLALQGELEDHQGSIAFRTSVERITTCTDGGFVTTTEGGDTISTRAVINSAGLYAQDVANRIEGLDASYIPKLTLAKGSYFGCATRPAFKRLIYPAPVDGGLGVHVTLDLSGRMRFGPDVEWLHHCDPAKVDYSVDIQRAREFYAAVRRYWPSLPDDAIAPDYAGCRPKLSEPGMPATDFRIDGHELHGLCGLVNLFGIESPGLTGSLAIGDLVAKKLADL